MRRIKLLIIIILTRGFSNSRFIIPIILQFQDYIKRKKKKKKNKLSIFYICHVYFWRRCNKVSFPYRANLTKQSLIFFPFPRLPDATGYTGSSENLEADNSCPIHLLFVHVRKLFQKKKKKKKVYLKTKYQLRAFFEFKF